MKINSPYIQANLLKIVAAGVVALFLFDKIVISRVTTNWSEQGERLTDLRAKVQRGQQLLDRESSLRGKWNDMMKANLPEEISVAQNTAVKAVGRWGHDAQVTLTGLTVTPQWQTRDGYKTLECNISANGDQASIGRFLYELETDPIPVNLEECEVTTRDAHGSQLAFTARFNFLRLPDSAKKTR